MSAAESLEFVYFGDGSDCNADLCFSQIEGKCFVSRPCAVTKLADCPAIGQSDLGHFLMLLFDLGDIKLLSRGA